MRRLNHFLSLPSYGYIAQYYYWFLIDLFLQDNSKNLIPPLRCYENSIPDEVWCTKKKKMRLSQKDCQPEFTEDHHFDCHIELIEILTIKLTFETASYRYYPAVKKSSYG